MNRIVAFSAIFISAFVVSSPCFGQQSTSSTNSAIVEARKWYEQLPADERAKVDARYQEYAKFMQQLSAQMNEKLQKVDLNERMLYIDRQNEATKKLRGNAAP